MIVKLDLPYQPDLENPELEPDDPEEKLLLEKPLPPINDPKLLPLLLENDAARAARRRAAAAAAAALRRSASASHSRASASFSALSA